MTAHTFTMKMVTRKLETLWFPTWNCESKSKLGGLEAAHVEMCKGVCIFLMDNELELIEETGPIILICAI